MAARRTETEYRYGHVIFLYIMWVYLTSEPKIDRVKPRGFPYMTCLYHMLYETNMAAMRTET